MEISVRSLSEKYGEKTALCNFSYTFTDGVYAILGPNGAGKSTLIHLMTDNVRRQSGEILYNGKEILNLGRDYRKKIGFMPQSQGIYDAMSAREFLSYMAEVKGVTKKQAHQQIKELLSIVNLEDAAYKKVGTYSGGMKQRVLLAQALLGDPEVLFLDEPSAGLDPEERVRLRAYIEKLAKEKIVLITTHITSDIESIANQVLIIKAGHLIISGNPDELLKLSGTSNLEAAYIKLLHTEDRVCGN